MANVYIEYRNNCKYPKETPFSPSKEYPERILNIEESRKNDNIVYDMVRDCLRDMELDIENYDTSEWNPLGKYIKPGQTILIKPNLVNNANVKKRVGEDSLNCLITHPSCVRAVCDYCLIALKGKGKIVIADAPIQDCDIEKLWAESGYLALENFYKLNGFDVQLCDLRSFMRVTNKLGVQTCTKKKEGNALYVSMNDKTAFHDLKDGTIYNVPNYDSDETTKYHKGKHVYGISEIVLEADVVINMCKPKTHRYAGITAAMKNVVGMIAEKETLPHRRPGSQKEGGDSFSGYTKSKAMVDKVLYLQTKAEKKNETQKANLYRFAYGFLYFFIKATGQDPSLKGCWHGNDTIWRTILDINYILKYANKKGKLESSPQRTVFNFADMIVAGQHNGPLAPEPKNIGAILCCEDAYCLDFLICKMMHFDYNKIPLLSNIRNQNSYIDFKDFEIKSNYAEFCGLYSKIVFPDEWSFTPHDAWKEILRGK